MVTTAGYQGRAGPKVRRLVLSIFVAWNLLSLAVWIIIPESQFRNTVLPVFKPYLVLAGLCQDFWVFSPDVNTSSADITADVTLSDGSVIAWEYPNNSHIELFEKPFKERYREFATAILVPKNRFLLPDTAAFIARQVYCAHPDNPPVMVSLNVVWQEIPPPSASRRPLHGKTEFFKAKVEVDR